MANRTTEARLLQALEDGPATLQQLTNTRSEYSSMQRAAKRLTDEGRLRILGHDARGRNVYALPDGPTTKPTSDAFTEAADAIDQATRALERLEPLTPTWEEMLEAINPAYDRFEEAAGRIYGRIEQEFWRQARELEAELRSDTQAATLINTSATEHPAPKYQPGDHVVIETVRSGNGYRRDSTGQKVMEVARVTEFTPGVLDTEQEPAWNYRLRRPGSNTSGGTTNYHESRLSPHRSES